MGKGKKKGKKEAEEAPSVAGLSISEDAPSTSQASAAPKEPPKAEAKAEPEPKVEEEEGGLGLGLGGGGKKRPRKKKSLAAAEAAKGPAQPEELGAAPVAAPPQPQGAQRGVGRGMGPGQGQPQGFPGQGQPQGFPGQGQPQGLPGQGQLQGFPGQGQPQAFPGQGQPQGFPGQGFPGQGQPQGFPGLGPPQGFPGRGQPQGFPGQGQSQGFPGRGQPQGFPGRGQPGYTQGQQRQPGHPPQGQTPQGPRPQGQPSAATSQREIVLPSSGKELACRYRIPAKILSGRESNVRSSPIRVMTNYFPMTIKGIKIYRYDVTVVPDKPKKMMSAVFKKVKETHYPKDFIAFDQAKNCYALQPLKNVSNTGERYSIEVQVPDANKKVMTFQVSLKSTGVVDLGKIQNHMDGQGSSLNTPSEEIQCVDVILRQGALEAYVKCGRQFFKRPANPINLTGGLEMWTGLFQSAIFTSKAFINIDVAHKGFPIQQDMISAIKNSFRLDVNQPIEQQRSREVDNFQNFIKGLRVIAKLVGGPNSGQTREYICNGLVDPPSNVKFTCERDGKKITTTVADYFRKEKGYRIQYPNLNCMWVGPKDRHIYYPMELLEVSYGQPMSRQLNEMQLATIVKEAATPPIDRKKKIDEAAAAMNYSTNAFFKKFGLEISDKFLEVEAKILMPPNLDVGEQRPLMPKRGSWQTSRLVKPQPLQSWGFIAIDNSPATSNYDTIKDLLTHTGRNMGMAVAEPRLLQFNVRMTSLRNILFQALENDVSFLFIIVPSRVKDTYHKVKQMAERDVGILTQCIKDQTASRRMNPQTMKNILLKVNSKLMGINQVLHASTMPACLAVGGVMVVGADVTHPSPEQTSIPSIAAVTASMDPKCFIYNIELSIQTPKKEMIVEFMEMMYDHLKLYRERNRALPKKIYVFRDGVSEGQFAEVLNSELSAIHNAYRQLNPNEKPEVLFLLVQKRHHTRFFTVPHCNNVEPGTVVDTHIVHPKELDFYLVSHQAIKGTARPTRYHAICNDSKIPHAEVEQLTYYLCHLYSRCMRAVSYPTPTYYAHLACFRARSLTYGQVFDNKALEKNPQRLRVLDKMLSFSRMFFV